MDQFALIPTSEWIAAAVSALLLLGYHAYLRHRVRHSPGYTVQSVSAHARRLWVDCIMAERRDILAVQTLRNSAMFATFLASTAALLIIGVLTLSAQGEKISSTWHALNVFGTTTAELWLSKLLILLFDLLVAFFHFTTALRLYNHVGYLVNVPQHLPGAPQPATVATLLNSAGRHLSLGVRCYYFTLPLLFWLFGPHLLVLATLALIALLHRVDRAPQDDLASSEG